MNLINANLKWDNNYLHYDYTWICIHHTSICNVPTYIIYKNHFNKRKEVFLMHVIFRLQEKKSTRHSIKNFLSIFTHRKRKRRFNNFAHLFEVSPKDILHTSIVYKDAATNTLSYLVAACLITSKIEEGRSLSLISSPESRVCVQHALIFFY